MTKKKKTASKQSKQNLQKPSGKPGKEASSPKKSTSETAVKKDTQSNSVQSKAAEAQPAEVKEKQPEQGAAKPPKTELPKPKTETVKKSDLKSERAAPKENAPKEPVAKSETPKQGGKTAAAKPVDASKSEEIKPSGKGQGKGGKGKKKDKAPRQSISVDDMQTAPSQQVAAPESQPTESEPARKVAKTLSEVETDFSAGKDQSKGDAPPASEPLVAASAADTEPPPAAADAPRKIAKTILEVDIGSLKQATAKATGAEIKDEAPPVPERKVAKTLMDVSTDGLRDAVEASARAIEDEIAAAIKAAEAESQSPPDASTYEIAAAPVNEKPEAAPVAKPFTPSERRVARTMIDVRAEELFELANSDIDTLIDEDESPQAQSEQPLAESSAEAPQTQPAKPPAEPPQAQPRKVAKTMLEINAPDLSAAVKAAQPAAEQPVAQDRQPGTDDVSIEDLSEFAQALKEDKPMAPLTARAQRLRKTMLGIRRHGLSSRASLPGMNAPADVIQSSSPEAEEKHAPVHISRSLHPLDNFSFDNLCPADEEQGVSEPAAGEPDQVQSFAPDQQAPADGSAEGPKRTGTVELSQDPHAGGAGEGFKGVSTVWPHDQEQSEQREHGAQQDRAGLVKAERFVAKTMLDMDFLKESLSASVVRAEEKMAESIALKMSEPPKPTLTADDYKPVQPGCPFTWAEGESPKEKVRYCSQCSSHIYNFAGFDLAESQALIFKMENRENAPIFKREDGKFMTRNCPIAVKKHKDKVMMIAGGVLIAALFAAVCMLMPQSPPPVPPPAVTDTPTVVPGATKTGSSTGTSSTVNVPPLATGAKEMSTKDGKGGMHYVRGKGIVERAPVIVAPPAPQDTTVPGTTSGYGEKGSFWTYTDKGNN